MGAHIYNLKAGGTGLTSFYHNLSDTTSEILDLLLNDPCVVHVSEFRDFIDQQKIEPTRSLEEYLIEYIMIGLYWQKYAGYASGLSNSVKNISDILYYASQSSKSLKEPVKKLRGMLAHRYLRKKDNSYELVPIVENFDRLIKWLDATKDFGEEVKRLNNWHLFFKSKSPIYISRFLSTNKEITVRFTEIAKKNLSIYTKGVKPFTDNIHKKYKDRDDVIFCSRTEDEYLFIMIATEIMNRSQRTTFDEAPVKIVLLPDCMSMPPAGSCRAVLSDLMDMTCKGCNAQCQINIIKKKLDKRNMDVRVVSQKTSFPMLINKYAEIPGVAIVGVACILNVLAGGYQMISAGIPAQLMFLDFCSCMKHWPGINQPTEVNQEELFRKLEISPSRISNLEIILN